MQEQQYTKGQLAVKRAFSSSDLVVLSITFAGFLLLSSGYFIISYFTSGTTQTLPIYIYSMTRKRISPEINALSTVLFVCIMLLLIIINVRQGREERRAKQAERERA